MVSYQILINPD